MTTNIDIIARNYNNRSYFSEDEICYDIVFVININSRGWILEKICKIIERHSDLNCYFLYSERNESLTYPLPKARAYFFAHFSLAFWAMVRNPAVFGASIFVYFTHFDKTKGIALTELAQFMNYCDHVFCMNSSHRRALLSVGVEVEKVTATIGGADPDFFLPHQRGQGRVGFVGAYYPRKQPEKMLELVRSMPDIQFQLLAPGAEHVDNPGMLWKNWPDFHELISLDNITYIEAPYEEYPSYYNDMDIYVSLSAQEGGPIPLIEAMMANAIPFATDTGFAQDILQDGLSGNVLPIDCPVEHIATKIRAALADQERDFRARALAFSWQAKVEQILTIMQPEMGYDRAYGKLPVGQAVNFAIGGDAHNLLGQGWRYVGKNPAMANPDAALSFRVPDSEPGFYRLTVKLIQRGEPQIEPLPNMLLMHANGRVIGSAKFQVGLPVIVDGWLNLDEVEAQSNVEITFTWKEDSGGEEVHDLTGTEAATILLEKIPTNDSVDEFSFDDSGNGLVLLGNSWHHPEIIGTWTKHDNAGLAVLIGRKPHDRNVRLSLSGAVFGASMPGGGKLVFKTLIDGRFAQHVVDLEHDLEIDTQLPPIIVPANCEMPIVISILKRHFKPSDVIEFNKDKRELGYQIKKVSVECFKLS